MPLNFWKHLNSILKKRDPGVLLIAQEDGLWPELTDSVENDHIGFDYKWSGGWTRDFLFYLSVDPILRKNYHDQLTLSTLYAYSGALYSDSWKQRCRKPGSVYVETSGR